MKGLTILGSTGSVGVNTLDVVRGSSDKFRIVALTANTQDEAMARQCLQYQPAYAVMADAGAAARLRARLRDAGSMSRTEVLCGAQGLEQVSALTEVDYVMAAIVGAAGLLPTLAAARAGKRILLANKEALVMSGDLFMRAVREGRAELLPIDSEHNAVFQCMPASLDGALPRVDGRTIRRVILTASGGPFRNRSMSELANVSPAEACAHPNWVMGRKISVDSATMMNKGLEVIEACWLFDTTADSVEVVVHPQSVVHSMVEYADGSVLAQMGNPDMRTPIAHALAWPGRISSGAAFLDLIGVSQLNFEAADLERFPCLALGYEAARRGGAYSAVLNAANEVAVAAFLGERIRFNEIPQVIERTLYAESWPAPTTLEDVLCVDSYSRERAASFCVPKAA